MPPLDDLPNGFTAPTRAQIRDGFGRDTQLRQPGAPVGPGSQAFIDGSVLADTLTPLYADAISIGRGANLRDMTRAQLNAECVALGIPEELPESGSSGFVEIEASVGGVLIEDTRELRDEATKLRYRCAVADTYFNKQAVPVVAIDTGPTTNIAAGTKLTWSSPPSGLSKLATVVPDANGDGFLGGRFAETDDDIINRIIDRRANPPAGGNPAQVRDLVVKAGRALGIAIQKVFVYPAITGSGHYAYCFTLRPGKPGSSRIPNAVQVAAVLAFLTNALPKDDGIFASVIIEEPLPIKIGIDWVSQGWVDASPWPIFTDDFYVSAVTSSTSFNVKSLAGSPTAPQVGQTFAFYNKRDAKFARKRVGTVASLGGGEYSIVVDVTNNASDPNYLPAVNERLCPFSPSLDLIPETYLQQLTVLGPGEQEEDFFDEGFRQKRDPPHPVEAPYALRHNSVNPLGELPQVADVKYLSPAIPAAASVGVPGVSSNLIVADTILIFPAT